MPKISVAPYKKFKSHQLKFCIIFYALSISTLSSMCSIHSSDCTQLRATMNQAHEIHDTKRL